MSFISELNFSEVKDLDAVNEKMPLFKSEMHTKKADFSKELDLSKTINNFSLKDENLNIFIFI